MESKNAQHNYQNIGGWFNFQDIYLAMVALADDGARFVEIGTFLGKSASFMANEIKASGKVISFETIDTFKGSPTELEGKHKYYSEIDVYQRAKNNLKDLPARILVGESVKWSEQYEDASLDFVFIDGSHVYEDVKRDIEAWLPKVKPGGYIGGHDFDNNDVKKAVVEVIGFECPKGANSWLIRH